MHGRNWLLAPLLTSVALLNLNGCGSPAAPVVPQTDSHDHAHHDHGEMTGPRGGHILELGHEDFHAEWLHDDQAGKLSVYILDGDVANDVPVESNAVEIDTEIEGAESKTYALTGVEPSDGKTAHFEIVDPTLLTTIQVAGDEGAKATLKVTIDGQRYKAGFTRHQPHDGHAH